MQKIDANFEIIKIRFEGKIKQTFLFVNISFEKLSFLTIMDYNQYYNTNHKGREQDLLVEHTIINRQIIENVTKT